MDKRVIKAKIRLMFKQPFWGSLIVRLQLRDWDGPTFATNGKSLFVPKNTDKYSQEELQGILAHETFHCAALHVFRLKNKHQLKWNVAADYATNLILTKNGFTFPKEVLLDNKYEGMTAEKIYNQLPDPTTIKIPLDLLDPGQGQEGDNKDEKGKNNQDGPSIEVSAYGVDPKELEQEWKEAVTNAVQTAKSRGTMPSGLEEYIDEILFPKVPWQEILYRFLQSAKGNTDFTSYPFDRRHIWREVYLPSMRGESIELCCGIDTSGSISHEDLTRYMSELRGICSIFGSYTIHLWMCDAAIHGEEQIITEDSDIPTIVMGRGGTSFVPVFEEIEKQELGELPVVYFTDLDGEFPKYHVGDGVFWMIRKDQNKGRNHEVPFGEIITIDD